MPNKYGVLPSGLSVPIAWLGCTGMVDNGTRLAAQDKIFRLIIMSRDCVQTKKDRAVVKGWIDTFSERAALSHCIIRELRVRFGLSTNSVYGDVVRE